MTRHEHTEARIALELLHSIVNGALIKWRNDYRETGSQSADYVAATFSAVEGVLSEAIRGLPPVGSK